MKEDLVENTVQHTLCIPLWGRMLAAKKYPDLLPDYNAEYIINEMNLDFYDNILSKVEYFWLNSAVRQYDFSCEISNYLKNKPNAVVCELGAGLSTLRSQMGNITNDWYNLDMDGVIRLREKYITSGQKEKNITCDLNDFSWFDLINFRPENGIVFVAGGLFYYFKKSQVLRLVSAMAEQFPGGMIAFDATNHFGLKGINREVKMAGNTTRSFFYLDNPKEELESWSRNIVNVYEKDYMRGYLNDTRKFSFMTQVAMCLASYAHTSFIVHAEYKNNQINH